MITLEEKRKIRREEKRLKSKIKDLEAIPPGGALIAVAVVAVVTGLSVPLTPAGFLLALLTSIVTAFIVMAVLFFKVDGDLTRLKEERAALKRRRQGVNTPL